MGLQETVASSVERALTTQVRVSDARGRVPNRSDLRFLDGGGAALVEGTYVYADLAGSSELAQKFDHRGVANILRAYVVAATKVFEAHQGGVLSFDGDRVMALFPGDDRNVRAVKSALILNGIVTDTINPLIEKYCGQVAQSWKLKHVVGIDCGQALVVRGGTLTKNDLISVGGAPNIAAKLSDIRPPKAASIYHVQAPWYSIYITEAVLSELPEELTGPTRAPGYGAYGYNPYTDNLMEGLFGGGMGKPSMWTWCGQPNIGGTVVSVWGSDWVIRDE